MDNQDVKPRDVSTRVILICHAEGMHNRYLNLVNDDSGLTATGWEQADALAMWLRNHQKIDFLMSASPLHSRLTAQRIGQALGLPVTVVQDLPGRLNNHQEPVESISDIPMLDPEIHTSTHNAVTTPYMEFHHGLISSLNRLLQEHLGHTMALVGSTSAIATIVRHFFGTHQLQIAMDYTGLSELKYREGQWCLCYVNRLEHIPRPTLPQAEVRAAPTVPVKVEEDLAEIAKFYNAVAAYNISREQSYQYTEKRNRIQHLLHFAQLPENLRVLDVGSGEGVMALELAENGAREVVGTDISPTMLEHAEYLRLSKWSSHAQRVSYRLASVHSLPFPNDSFDVVTCRLVLHHSHKPEYILQGIARVLKPGGIFVLADLLSADDPVKSATQNAIEERRNLSHVAARSAEKYRSLVVRAGFIIEKEEVAIFERDLEDWLSDLQTDFSSGRVTVREMVEAGLETDAAGINARREGDRLVFDQRLFYLKAIKL